MTIALPTVRILLLTAFWALGITGLQDAGKPTEGDDLLDYSGQRTAAKKAGLQGSDIMIGSPKDDVLVGDLNRGDKRKDNGADFLVGGDGDDVIYCAVEKPAKGQFDPKLYREAVDEYRVAMASYQHERSMFCTGAPVLANEGRPDENKKKEWEEAVAKVTQAFGENPKFRAKGAVEQAVLKQLKAKAALDEFEMFRSEPPDFVVAGEGWDTVYLGPGDGSLVILGPEADVKEPSKPKTFDGIAAKMKTKNTQTVVFGPGCAMVVVHAKSTGICRFVNYDASRHRIGVQSNSGYVISMAGTEVVFRGTKGNADRQPFAHVDGRSLSLILMGPDEIDPSYVINLGGATQSTQGVPYDNIETLRRSVSFSVAFLKTGELEEVVAGKLHVADLPKDSPQRGRAITEEAKDRSLAAMAALCTRAREALGEERFHTLVLGQDP